MIKEYTEEKAKEAVDLLNESTAEWFCPLIRDFCMKKCVCFVPAYSRSNNKFGPDEKFQVHGFNCGNAMFSGEVFNTNQY